ncbi:sensor histidine kinase [Nocardia arthritidis]|uniref:Sensor histidine kinase n=1 Tax=Nocardia arthritidis TaxID=228602 RepID=A0A6G9YHX3_9NOCA|nr:sensor histidine kinase [Nocardia arthritidis]QIS12543.1 sensor histidine kinase [Nocardia arthritidis]
MTAPGRWDILYRIWSAYVVGGIIATGVLVIVLRRVYGGEAWVALVALTCLLAWSALLSPRRDNPDAFYRRRVSRNSVLFVVGVLLFFHVAVWWSPPALAGVVVVYALIYMTLPVWAAIVVAEAVSFTPLVFALVAQTQVPLGLAISLVAILFNPAIGATITLALDRSEQLAILLDQLERSRADVARLSREAGSMAERARLAREIHDTLTQGFTGIATLAQAVESEFDTDPDAAHRHIALIEATARENLIEARTMVETLTPPDLGGGSLADSVRRRCRKLADETGIAVTVNVDCAVPQLDTGTEVVLLRAAQEALTNVSKHARADSVTVDLTRTGQGVRLSVADNGIGFDAAGAGGFGLPGLRSRAQEIGAVVTVTTSPGAGTRVAVEVPA